MNFSELSHNNNIRFIYLFLWFYDILPWGVPPGEFLDINPGDDRGGPETGVPGLLLPGPNVKTIRHFILSENKSRP